MTSATVIEVVAPVFLLIGVGYAFGAFRSVDLTSLTDVVVYLAAPALIFHSLITGTLHREEMLELAAGVTTVVVGVGLVLLVVSRVLGYRPGALYLPAMFMNAGNMLLPLTLLAFGEAGLRRAVVIFVTVAVLQSSLGVTIARGYPSPFEMFRLPYIYAVAAAWAVREGYFSLWPPAGEAVELVGHMAVPAMLLALGLRLRTVEPGAWSRPLAVATLRIGGGYVVALAFVTSFGVEGLARSCLLLASVMPSAVINFVFAEKYGNASGDVATAVIVSTVASVVTTPLLLAYGL